MVQALTCMPRRSAFTRGDERAFPRSNTCSEARARREDSQETFAEPARNRCAARVNGTVVEPCLALAVRVQGSGQR